MEAEVGLASSDMHVNASGDRWILKIGGVERREKMLERLPAHLLQAL